MKILVVDDDTGNLALAVRMLGRIGGAQVSTATSGAQALEAASLASFDTILLDISMPGMDGTQTCRALRARPQYQDCRILACTAHAGRAELEDYLRSGFSATLTKPFLLDELRLALMPDTAKG